MCLHVDFVRSRCFQSSQPPRQEAGRHCIRLTRSAKQTRACNHRKRIQIPGKTDLTFKSYDFVYNKFHCPDPPSNTIFCMTDGRVQTQLSPYREILTRLLSIYKSLVSQETDSERRSAQEECVHGPATHNTLPLKP